MVSEAWGNFEAEIWEVAVNAESSGVCDNLFDNGRIFRRNSTECDLSFLSLHGLRLPVRALFGYVSFCHW